MTTHPELTHQEQAANPLQELERLQAQAAAELSELRTQQNALESQLRGLARSDLGDEAREQERQRIRGEHRAVLSRQQSAEDWKSRLESTLEGYQRRTVQPRRALREAETALAGIDERSASRAIASSCRMPWANASLSPCNEMLPKTRSRLS